MPSPAEREQTRGGRLTGSIGYTSRVGILTAYVKLRRESDWISGWYSASVLKTKEPGTSVSTLWNERGMGKQLSLSRILNPKGKPHKSQSIQT